MERNQPGAPRETTLLMTSTIKPFTGLRNNDRSDPELRLSDYKHALTRYLALPAGPPDRILFVDNSRFGLGELEEIAEKNNPHDRPVSFLSIEPAEPERKSKPYGEMDILDQALDLAFPSPNHEAVVWKVTGRLFVPNIASLSRSLPSGSNLYCDLRDLPLVGQTLGGNPWFDMRLWAYTPLLYREVFYDLKRRLPNIDEGSMFETVRNLLGVRHDISPRFKTQPRFEGHLAATNRDYGDLSLRLKNGVRKISRRIAPGLWI